jgi:hypothetical protein
MTSATYIFRETTRPEPIRDSALTFLRIYDLLISAGFLYIFASSALIPIGRAIERRSIGAVSVLAIVGLVFLGASAQMLVGLGGIFVGWASIAGAATLTAATIWDQVESG